MNIAISQFLLANLFYTQNNFNKAIFYCNKALVNSEGLGASISLKNISTLLYKCYKVKKNYKNALKMHELSLDTRDTLESVSNQKEVIRQEYKYAYEKQAAVDSVANAKEQAIKEETIKRQQVELSS